MLIKYFNHNLKKNLDCNKEIEDFFQKGGMINSYIKTI